MVDTEEEIRETKNTITEENEKQSKVKQVDGMCNIDNVLPVIITNTFYFSYCLCVCYIIIHA